MTSTSLTAIVARDFRGTTLFLKSFTPEHSTFIWSKNRMDAESFPVAQVLTVIEKARQDWAADAYAIDSAGEIIKPGKRAPVSHAEARRTDFTSTHRNHVHCLIYDHPSQLGEYVLVLNSLCPSAEAARVFLEDRIANGQAFASERCATMTRAEYNTRNVDGKLPVQS